MKLNKTIKSAMISLLNEEIVVTSWGISDISIKENSFCFHVDGFRYKGSVSIISNDLDTLDVELANKQIHNIKPEDILTTLDEIIEASDNYLDELQIWVEHKINK